LDSTSTPDDFSLLSESEANELDVEVKFGIEAKSLNSANKSVTTAVGENISADAILLAMGGGARKLPIEGADLEGVFTLRDFNDAQAIRQAAGEARHATVVGGGLIGAECVASFLSAGLKVLWLDAAPMPLTHILPECVAQYCVEKIVNDGASLIPSARIEGLSGIDGKVASISVNCFEYQTDMVLFGVGMSPNVGLALDAGLVMEAGGVRVDHNQMTNADGVYALGDMAAVSYGNGWKREEHWRASEVQGARAAHAILSKEYIEPDATWFWSDQGSRHIEMVGVKGTRSVQRVSEGKLCSFEFDSDALVGAASVNDPNAVRIALRMIKAGKTPQEEALKDPTQDLRRLLRV